MLHSTSTSPKEISTEDLIKYGCPETDYSGTGLSETEINKKAEELEKFLGL